jgi:hypothetical protein
MGVFAFCRYAISIGATAALLAHYHKRRRERRGAVFSLTP